MTTLAPPLRPRKSPAQARSAATIETLHAAAIQVLTREGLGRCTTTRIAERAGVSVGSLYQYYPNRDALLAAVLERHLSGVAEAVEGACRDVRGQPAARMASALAAAFLGAKLRDPLQSKALYAVAERRGGPELAARMHARMAGAISALLATAPDARFDDPATAGAMALGAMAGPVRAMLEGCAPEGFEARLEHQLALLLTAYLEAHRPPID